MNPFEEIAVITTPPSADLGLVVVIPCFNEPDLLATLNALTFCDRPPCGVEVITVINHSDDAPAAIQWHNQQTLAMALAWNAQRSQDRLACHFLYYPQLSSRHAGVGWARKLGMDQAMERLLLCGRPQGVIVALDADCVVADNYLVALQTHFQAWPKTPGCSIYFEHPLSAVAAHQRDGIAAYELSLRYIVQGWRYCGLPNAFHTVGSSMAVRVDAYRKQGGMNRRQAGEDFYFLQKIMALGGFTNLGSTTVYPSPRVSHRVPFGTGRAMAEWMTQAEASCYRVWHPEVFAHARHFFASVAHLYPHQDEIPGTSDRFGRFLMQAGFAERLQEMRRHTASPAAFTKRFFHWFDGFRFLKWAHWATADGLEEQPVTEAAARLLDWSQVAHSAVDVEGLLNRYRHLDQCR